MTLLTSLFNKGIYKSTIRRFIWGSVFYFVLLFLMTGMVILMSKEPNAGDYTRKVSYILNGGMMFPGIYIGIIVPTITAMLVYRFVHSKKLSIFVHSLPIKREANFVSSMLAGLTLMAAPIILNGIILAVMSLSGYGYLYSVVDCIKWITMNLFCVGTLFAYSTLAAMLTGNTFTVVVLNLLLHTFLLLIGAGFGSFAEAFLHGYAGTNSFLDFVAYNNPVTIVAMNTEAIGSPYNLVNKSQMIWSAAAAVVIYALSLAIYKKRRMETAEDVAAFKKLNPVYKYFVTFICALGAFSLFANSATETRTLIIAVIIVSAVAYFGCEMALKKTFKVWRSYKGYIGFGVVFAMIISVFCFTSFFGFETRVPEVNDIESVAVYTKNRYNGIPFVSNEDIKEYATVLHKERIESVTAEDKWYAGDEMYPSLEIIYTLKNGNTIRRRYGIDSVKHEEIMGRLYKNDEYTMANERIFNAEYDNFTNIEFNGNISIPHDKRSEELLQCIRKDMLEIDFNQREMEGMKICDIPVEVTYYNTDEDGKKYSRHESINVNVNFKNTMNWFAQSEYRDQVFLKLNEEIYLCDDTWDDKASANTGVRRERDKVSRYVRLYTFGSAEELKKITDFIYSYEVERHSDKKYYVLCLKNNVPITCIEEDELPILFNMLGIDEITY